MNLKNWLKPLKRYYRNYNNNGSEWLRVQAKAIDDDRYEVKKSMLDNYPSLQAIYSATDDNTQVLYLKDAVATFSSFSSEPKTVKF